MAAANPPQVNMQRPEVHITLADASDTAEMSKLILHTRRTVSDPSDFSVEGAIAQPGGIAWCHLCCFLCAFTNAVTVVSLC